MVSNCTKGKRCGDNDACLLNSGTYRCESLTLALQATWEGETTSDQHIFAEFDHVQKEEVAFEGSARSNKRTTIACVGSCKLSLNLRLVFGAFNEHFVVEFSNMTFQNTLIAIRNVHMHFTNVMFLNSFILDEPTEPGEFGAVLLRFSNVSFTASSGPGGSAGLELNETFSVFCSLTETVMSGVSVHIRSRSSFLSMVRSRVSAGFLSLVSDNMAFVSLEAVDLLNLDAPVFRVEAPTVKAVVVSVSVRNSSGGLALRTRDSGLRDSWLEARVVSSTFTHNAKMGSGGTIALSFTTSSSPRRSSNSFDVINCSFISNAVVQNGQMYAEGGALSLHGQPSKAAGVDDAANSVLFVVIRDSFFVDNQAENGAGALYFSQNFLDISIQKCHFSYFQQEVPSLRGLFILGHSSVSVEQSEFLTNVDNTYVSLVDLQLMTLRSAVRRVVARLQCLPWHSLVVRQVIVWDLSNHSNLQRLALYCVDCPPSLYRASDGLSEVSYLGSNDNNVDHSGKTNCTTCPQGGYCPGNDLQARPNYWGYRTADGIVFKQCPVGYCCAGTAENPCTSYKGCEGFREGVLCCCCRAGYSQSILSNNCILDKNCDDTWFWPVFVLGAFLYMFWYTCKDMVLAFPVHLWKKMKGSQANTKQPVNYIEKGYFGILIYFVQATSVMRLDVFQNSQNSLLSTLRKTETNIGLLLTVELSYVQADVCPMRKMNLTHKLIAKFMFLLGIFVCWLVIYLTVVSAKQLFGSNKSSAKALLLNRAVNTLIGGLVKIIKYSFGGYTKIFFFSLLCISVESQKVWKHDASVRCFSTWQKTIAVFGICYVVPFPFMLFTGMYLLERRQISGNILLAGTFCPLPFLLLWLPKMMKSFVSTSDKKTTVNVNSAAWLGSEEDKKMYNRFKRGYRSEGGAQYWESVVIMRRLLLSSTSLLPNQAMKLGVCLVLCCMFLSHHNYKQPFLFPVSNKIETVSLLLLCGQAVVNLMKSLYLNLGVSADSSQAEMLSQLAVLESASLPGLLVSILLLEIAHILHTSDKNFKE